MQVAQHLFRREPLEPLEPLAERLPAEQLHHEERHLRGFVAACVEDVDDELALDMRSDLRLEPKASAHPVALHNVRMHHLERAATFCLEVDHLVDSTHPALRY